MRFYPSTHPIMKCFGTTNAALLANEKAGNLPPRFYLLPGGRKPVYDADLIDALVESRAKNSESARAKNLEVSQRLVAGRRAKAEARAARVLADAEVKAAKILEGRRPRAAAKKEGEHDNPA